MRLRIHALGVEAEVLRKTVQKRALPGLHRLEALALKIGVYGEGAEVPLLCLGPRQVLEIHVQRLGLVGDVVVLAGLGVDIECESESAVALEAGAFVVAFERLGAVSCGRARGTALGLLLDALAVAGDEYFVLAWFSFFADAGDVALVLARVGASLLFAAILLAGLACIFALSGLVACLTAVVVSALESPTADFPATHVLQPARLVLELVFSTQAGLCG